MTLKDGSKYIGAYKNDYWTDGIIYESDGNKLSVIDGEIKN
jgi:hypothetical protein